MLLVCGALFRHPWIDHTTKLDWFFPAQNNLSKKPSYQIVMYKNLLIYHEWL